MVSARKYRPATFSNVVGQKNLTATLRNAIATDRLAHSYLFCGSRGVGKTSCARIFAKTINCEHRTPEGDPCNECESCRSFNEGRSFNIIELDAASNNGVEDMRRLSEQVMVPPTDGRYRVFIIDEVHMLSSAAFNAFLKTLEEPPSYIIFILATTEKQKIIPTILSRCQIYDFNRITVEDITEHLEKVAEAEGIPAERRALAMIAAKADGALRDALSIFDQIVASSRGNITYKSVIDNLNILDISYFMRLMSAFSNSDVAEALLIYKEIRDKGFNTHFFINGLQAFVRDLMVARDERTLSLLDATAEEKKTLAEIAERFQPEFFFMALSLINDADMKYREASNKTFLTELLLIKLCQLLSPSPVFRGKEEGHLDSLQPLGDYKKAASSVAMQANEPVGPRQDDVNSEAVVKNSEVHDESARVHLRPAGLKVKSIKINPSATINEKSATTSISSQEIESELTPEVLTSVWNEYIGTIPQKKMIGNLMKGSVPDIISVSPTVLRVKVGNELQKEIFEGEKVFIAEFMKSKLNLPSVEIQTIVVEGKVSPIMWSEREILDNMLGNYPAMVDFMKNLDLSLS